MIMKALTALLLSTTLLAAHAETASPSKAILATWCSVRQDKASHITRYRREVNPPKGEATCKGEDWMTVGPTGYDGGEFACKTIEGEMIFDAEINAIMHKSPPIKAYFAFYSCSGERSAWKERCYMTLTRPEDELVVGCFEQKGK
jgi:hypothetical protein